MNVLKIYDNGGQTFDRYTVVTNVSHNGLYECLGLSEHPNSPQGFSQWGNCIIGNHLGKEINFDELSNELQEHIQSMLKRETMWVCEHCLMAIESREGNQATLRHCVDEEDEVESKCDWCEETGFDTLYELV